MAAAPAVVDATGEVATTGLEARQGTILERAGTALQKVGTNLGPQRASTLPTDDKDLRHAATMPITHDIESWRPFCCGLWKAQQLFGCVLGVVSFLVLSLACPIELNGASNRMLGITVLCGCFWVFEVLPLYITALLPVIMMPIFAITSSAIAAQAYWNPIQMLVVGTYLVDIALEEVQLPRRLAMKVVTSVGFEWPGLILFLVMFACWILSMLCNNIAVALMISPFVIGIMNTAESEILDAAAMEHMESQRSEASEGTTPQLDSPTLEIHRFSAGLLLGIAYSTTAGGLATLVGCIPNELVMGAGLPVTYQSWLRYAFLVSLVTFCLAYFIVYVRYVRGLSLKAWVTKDVLASEYDEFLKEVGPFSRDEMIVAIVQLTQFALLFAQPWISNISVFKTKFGEQLLGDSTLACLPAVVLFFCPSVIRPGQSILTWPVVHEKFDFGLLLLIGGGFAIASGFVQSGLNIALGEGLAVAMKGDSPLLLTLKIVAMCASTSQLFSNIGTATTIVPILKSAATENLINPLSLVLPAIAACSFAFVLPTATPSNVIVLAKSRDLAKPLRIRDFVFTGLPLNVAMVLIGSVMLHFLGQAEFDASGPFPQWACDGVSCLWANVSGVVRGEEVASQACSVVNMTSMATCMLANKTVMNVSDIYIPQ